MTHSSEYHLCRWRLKNSLSCKRSCNYIHQGEYFHFCSNRFIYIWNNMNPFGFGKSRRFKSRKQHSLGLKYIKISGYNGCIPCFFSRVSMEVMWGSHDPASSARRAWCGKSGSGMGRISRNLPCSFMMQSTYSGSDNLLQTKTTLHCFFIPSNSAAAVDGGRDWFSDQGGGRSLFLADLISSAGGKSQGSTWDSDLRCCQEEKGFPGGWTITWWFLFLSSTSIRFRL